MKILDIIELNNARRSPDEFISVIGKRISITKNSLLGSTGIIVELVNSSWRGFYDTGMYRVKLDNKKELFYYLYGDELEVIQYKKQENINNL